MAGRQYITNPAAHRENARRYRRKLRKDLLDAYGWKCACCGEDHPEFLTIDHVGGGGGAERRRLNGQTYTVWASIRQRGFPDGYQTLCWNCNWAIGHYGTCPHQVEVRT